MAKDFKAIRDELAKGSRLYKAFAEVDEILAVLEGHEQNVKELTTAVADKKAEMDKVTLAVNAGYESVKKSSTSADSIVAEATTQAAKIVADAETDAAAALQAAKDDANNVGDAIEAANGKLASINSQIAEATAALQKLNDAATAQKAALAGALSNLS